MRLYEAVEGLAIVNSWLDEHADELLASGGELTPELAALLDQAEGDFRVKVERVALKVRELLATADAIKIEETRLAQRRKATENAATSLKAYLQRALEAAGETTVKGPLATVALQKNPPAVRGLVEPATLAAWAQQGSVFVTVVPASYVLDKKVVLEHYKQGLELPGMLTVEQGVSLRIR